MTWFLLSLLTAFATASTSAFAKKFFSDYSALEIGLIPVFYAMPLCVAGLLLVDAPELKPGFWAYLAWVVPLTMAGFSLHFTAIRISPLSLTLPFLSFTPVFMLLSGPLILGEHISLMGMAGLLLVVIGGYALNLDSARQGWLGPVRAIFRERGSLYMLAVSAIYAMTAVGGKAVILRSSPLFAAFTTFAIFGAVMPVLLLATRRTTLRRIFARPGLGLAVGLLMFSEILLHNLAVALVQAAYMVSIKRLSGLFSVIYGKLLFHERGIRYRAAGALLMAAGAAVIMILG